MSDGPLDIVTAHAGSGKGLIPMWLIGLILLLVLVGGSFWWEGAGGFRADVYDVGVEPARAEAPTDPMVIGQRLYSRNCAVCHLPNGAGLPGQFPPLAGSEWVLAEGWHGDNHLVKIVLQGMQGPVIVRGRTFNNAMVPWASVMNDAQIAAVLTYIRQSWGNMAEAISPEFVAGIRARTLLRTEPWTQKELEAIPGEKNQTFAPAQHAPQ